MTSEQIEQREKAYSRSCGVCFVCGKPLIQGQMQYAHYLGNREENRKRFGSFFIDSTFNGCLCCSLDCNNSVDIGKSIGNELKTLAEILIKETSSRIGKCGLDAITDLLLEEYKRTGYGH